MSRTETLGLSQTYEMPLINEALTDEIESLNAIYGEDTLCVNRVRSDGIETLFRLPTTSASDQLTFCLKFPITYPESAPVYLYANVGLFQTLDRRVQNIGLLIFLFLKQVFVPGNVCIFDLTGVLLPAVDCIEGSIVNPEKASELCPQLSGEDYRWMNKSWINMNNYMDMIDCLICCDEDYSFKMVQIPCKHSYCLNCLQTGWDLALEAGEPFTCCKARIPDDLICVYTNVTKEEYKEYLHMLYEKSVFNPFYCGYSNCTTLIGSFSLWTLGRGTVKTRGINCPKCTRGTCPRCRTPKHLGSCVVDEKMIELFKSADIRRCPKCGDAIEKNGGCAHIQCRRCDNHFWWEADGSLSPYDGTIYELNRR